MAEGKTGWKRIGKIEEADSPTYEEAAQIADELGDDYRAVEVYGDRCVVERRSEVGQRWVRLAELVGPDPYEEGENLAEDLSNSGTYRAVNIQRDGVVLEKFVDDS